MINLKLLALAVIFLLFCISFVVLYGGRTLIVKVELYCGTVASTFMMNSNCLTLLRFFYGYLPLLRIRLNEQRKNL